MGNPNPMDNSAWPSEDLSILLNAEGGCVSVEKACGLLNDPAASTESEFVRQIISGHIIAYQLDSGEYVVPKWQFKNEGGLLEGLPEVLDALRRKVPGFDEISPFTFFLQVDPITEGLPPLHNLRKGKLESVLKAIDGRIV